MDTQNSPMDLKAKQAAIRARIEDQRYDEGMVGQIIDCQKARLDQFNNAKHWDYATHSEALHAIVALADDLNDVAGQFADEYDQRWAEASPPEEDPFTTTANGTYGVTF